MILTTMQKALLTAAFIIVLTVAFISFLPKPIDIDLTNIGNGKNSVVFVYDINRVVSNQQAIQINKAQEVIGDNANFLIARTGYPETDAFIQQFDAEIAQLLFFDGTGQLTERKFALVEANTLIERLQN